MINYIFILLSIFQTQAKYPNLKSKKPKAINPLRITPTVKAILKTQPAVINIVAIKKRAINSLSFFPSMERSNSQMYKYSRVIGSGVIFNSKGYAITNDHVVSLAVKITVTLSNNKKYSAKIIGTDKKLDIAVLKINCKHPLPFAKLGSSSNLLPGETVIAIGSPHGFSFTSSKGVISGIHRNVLLNSRVYGNAIQTDAAINPGNSGGPLINILGEVIAINTFKKSNASNMGFAIPINKVKSVARELLLHKKVRAIYLGMTIIEKNGGIYISRVEKNSPIFKSGLRKGYKILQIKNYKITGLRDFSIVISTLIVGEKVQFLTSKGLKYVRVAPLSPRIAYQRFINNMEFSLTPAKKGLKISSIIKSGRAYSMGLRKGDIIKSVNGKKLINKKEITKILLSLRQTKTLYMIIYRNGYKYPLSLNY